MSFPGIASRLITALAIADLIDQYWPGKPWNLQLQGPWYIALDCGGPPPNCYNIQAGTTDPGDPFGGCLQQQYSWDYDGTEVPWGQLVNDNQRTVIFGNKVDQGFPQRYNTRMKVSRQPGVWPCAWGDWFAPACAPVVHPATPPVPSQDPFGDPVPRVPSWVDPFSQPISQPEPYPQAPPWWAIPLRQPNPWRSPNEQTETGPERKPRTRPRPRWPRPGVPVFPEPDPTGDPVGTPDPWSPGAEIPDITIEPGGDVTTSPAPDPGPESKPRPDKGKTREGKVRTKMDLIVRLLRGAVNFVTEGMDFVDAIYESIPNQNREGYYRVQYYDRVQQRFREFWRGGKGSHTPQARIRTVWNHWEDANIGDAVHNLVQNQVEDYVIGRLGHAQATATRNNPYWTSPVGPHAGVADTSMQYVGNESSHMQHHPTHQEQRYNPVTNRFETVTVPGRAPRR